MKKLVTHPWPYLRQKGAECMFNTMRIAVIGAAILLISCTHGAKEQPRTQPAAASQTVRFTVPGVDDVPDLWGDPAAPDLVIFFGGNEFMVLPELLTAFRTEYPQYVNIFCETLPPGILAEQIKTGKLIIGNLEISVRPDIITGGKERIEHMEKSGQTRDARSYAGNRLAIMVREGNPKGVRSLRDLGINDVKVSMPDSAIEDIGNKIEKAILKAGGTALVKQIVSTKVANGSTFITRIHHRQSPMRIVQKQSDAAPVWETETLYQQRIGLPIERVTIPESENIEAKSVAALLNDAPHPQAARDFLNFITGESAQQIYHKYGFLPP